ncbi:cysteine desulfurase family protein [Motilibacter aurantiacus]|uniref:cysteine desulfurase family protein n=1 Tax=Motilibacter aurantiacus TaxID=2714955 RepID=UPI00140BA782|nr:cysteine desulfurase family protein [Motilibacter aurantiacus]NHC44706.1 cysteine desulfurase [Motilibacter aurantiacus]
MAYLDHAATTPMLPEAVAVMASLLPTVGNASSLHAAGRRARRVVEESREQLASALGARPSEVVLTSSGTEADNLAVKGLYWSRRRADPRRRRVLVSAVEHHAVLDAAAWLAEHEGAVVELLPVDGTGRLDLPALAATVARDPASVALISVMWANNEVGTVQPVREVVALAAEHAIPVHSDAVQAPAQLPVSFADSGLAAMTVTAHKLGGPIGVGALLLGRGVPLVPLLHGGGQERDVRSGTLDTPAVAAFAAAAALAVEQRPERAARLAALRDDLVRGVLEQVPDALVNGDPSPEGRLPGIAHLSFPGCDGDSLLLLLDARGIECSTGSACSAGVPQPSHVLLAMGVAEERARGSLRFSLGHTSTPGDVEAAVAALAPVVERARRAGSAGQGRSSARERVAGAVPAGA